jgi:hypothetical protein
MFISSHACRPPGSLGGAYFEHSDIYDDRVISHSYQMQSTGRHFTTHHQRFDFLKRRAKQNAFAVQGESTDGYVNGV